MLRKQTNKKGVKFDDNYNLYPSFEQGTELKLRWVFILQVQGLLASASPA